MQPTRIQSLFDGLRKQPRTGLIAYITAGDPSPERTPEIVLALERGGVDLIELGVPFSDPIADGPVIQRGSDRALRAGTNVPKVLEAARKIREHSQIPLLLFTYMNPVLRYGLERLAAEAKAAGIDGCLLTDLSVEEAGTGPARHSERPGTTGSVAEPDSVAPASSSDAGSYMGVMRSAGLDTVFLAAPTSTDARLRLAAQYSTGFVYLVSRTGVTGERAALSDALGPLIARTRAVTHLPLAVGFGISTPQQAAAVAKVADAVVVGSAIVRMIEKNASGAELEGFARSLRDKMDWRA
jgi:tryptophan synthase alpha chain